MDEKKIPLHNLEVVPMYNCLVLPSPGVERADYKKRRSTCTPYLELVAFQFPHKDVRLGLLNVRRD